MCSTIREIVLDDKLCQQFQGFLVYPFYRKSLPHSNCKASVGWGHKCRI